MLRQRGLSRKRRKKSRLFVDRCLWLRLTVCLIRLGLAGLGCDDRVVWGLNNAGGNSNLKHVPCVPNKKGIQD